jgi:AbrB family looped-hinge helix DNA binding protein
MTTRKAAAIRLSTKGQVVIPRAVRSAVGWRSGTELQVEAEGEVVTLRPVRQSSGERWLADVTGCVERGDPVGDLEAEHRAEVARDARRRP